jgi:type IV pilus assembly protein PilQ
MKQPLGFALGLALLAPVAARGPGEVTGVSVLPAPGRAQVVIDVRGAVNVLDFTLTSPSRLVVDLVGATLRTRNVLYDGVNRGGVQNVRYSQFRPDVVRVVIELDSLVSYSLDHGDQTVRVSFGADRSFAAWSSLDPAALAPPAAASATHAAPEPTARTTSIVASSLPVQQGPAIISVAYDSAHVADVMDAFASYSGKTIILGKDVKGSVTARLNNLPWDVAFKAILTAQGLSAIEDPPGVILVDSRETLAARDTTEPKGTILVRVNYARAFSLVPTVKSILSKRGEVTADTATNSLIITDVKSRLPDDSVFVSRLDVRTRQVSIQAKLIFVDRTDIEDLGVRYDLGTPSQFFNQLVQRPDPSTSVPVDLNGDGVPDAVRSTANFSPDQNIINIGGNALSALANAQGAIAAPALRLIFSTAIGNFNLTSFVEALQQVQLADLQAEPLISTSDNTEANIRVGEDTPIRQVDVGQGANSGAAKATTSIVKTGIQLTVTPHVTNNGQVLMKIHAENSALQAAPADVGFNFATQQADNQILVNNGETAVIGGLTVTQVSVSKSGVPFLVDLPIIGRIFGFTDRREERKDLLILVTPHILDEPQAPGGAR